MTKKLASILAIALCLSSCGSTGTSTPSQTETTTTVASEVESQQYEELTLDDIIYPADVKIEIAHKRNGYYGLIIDDKWEMRMDEMPNDDDILEAEDYDAKLAFLLLVASDPDYKELIDKVDTSETSENGYTVYTFNYNGTTGYTACRVLGETKYLLSTNSHDTDIPTEEEFKEFISKLKIAP